MDDVLRKALYVEDEDGDVDFDTAPASGQDYLKRVIIEARKCDTVVVASIDTKKFKAQTIQYSNDSGCPPAPEGCLPTKEWQHHQVAQFSELRTRMVQHIARSAKAGNITKPRNLPSIDKEDEWSAFCYGPASDETGAKEDGKGTRPLVSIIISLNQYQVETLLEYNIRWLEEKEFSQQRGQWLYALLIKLEKPLIPEVCSLLRNLARICTTARANVKSPEDQLVPQLNLLICLVGRYFDQSDLADL